MLGGSSIDPDLEAGQTVGEYVIDKKIGQGGFGAVYKATHPLIGKVAAIKVLSRKFSVDPEMVARFIAEAKAVNQIRHRHIIDIFSFGQVVDGRSYYVMEYLDGEPLDARLERDGRMPLEQALPILRAIARALDAAHAKGIAHRDLKPENVFLARDEEGGYFPKLLDFGIAKLMAQDENQKFKTRTGIPIGTPYYMSPEQCRGKDVDHRTDYYAFGVVAYRMLTGELPIDGEDYMSVLMKQVSEDPPPPSSRVPDLPFGVDDAIAWLMKKDPAARPPTLMMAIRALEAAAETIGISVERGMASAAWDIATPSLGDMRKITGLPAAPVGTVRVGTPTPAPAVRGKKPTIIIAGAVGAAVVAVVVFAIVMSGGSGNDGSKAPPAIASSSPTPATNVAPTNVAPPPAVTPTPTPQQPVGSAQPVQDPAVTPTTVAAQTVSINLANAPIGSEVVHDGRVIATLPAAVTLPKGDAPVALVVRHLGYAPTTINVVPDQDREVKVVLHHATAAHPGTTGGPHDDHSIEDPFHTQ
jgi:eukaryotic-like serine/threonine-protein kinase